LLEALYEPAFIVSRDGVVLCASRLTKQQMGAGVVNQPLSNSVVGDLDAFKLYLERCFGSGQPLIGTVTLRTLGSERKFACRGSAFFADQDSFVLLRLYSSEKQSFAALTRTVEELKGELKKRKRSEARLAETVRERELLFRELEHRVKNNMQMLASMLQGAEREATSLEAKLALKDASSRFSAVSAVQQLLYRSEGLSTIDVQELIATLVRAAETHARHAIDTALAVDPVQLRIESAVPIGLVINELLTNAVKYGEPVCGTQTLRVELARKAGQLELVVKDNGPGFELSQARKRASGIGLVLGLLRQLGGSIRVEREDGARCVVTFPETGSVSVGLSG
jgi:two-component sensor histidine kinase